ncbi:MAG: hypothetical protein MN733_25205 [Nitrososphaera sp.]|nr:hypothetical protein [Nitrososphaera sp.]
MADKELSLEEIDKILTDLEKSLEISTPGEGVSVLEIQTGEKIPSPSDKSLLRFECPAAIWEEFADYCKRNELDPAQQIKEAVICYYKNLWETYRIRKKLHNDSELV